MAPKFIWRDRLGAGRAPAEGHRGGRGLDRAGDRDPLRPLIRKRRRSRVRSLTGRSHAPRRAR